MLELVFSLLATLRAALRSRRGLVLENLALRHQLGVLARSASRPRLQPSDCLLWIVLRRLWAEWRQALVLVRPETVVRWHREGFRRFWRRRSARRPGRPGLDLAIRALIRRIATANPLWGAPRIHGELLKLGITVSERTVSRCLPKPPRRPPSQTWRAFLANHFGELVSIDFFTVPTARYQVLFCFLVLAHDPRRVIHFNVTDLSLPKTRSLSLS
ncbi:MAG: hypothetical protein EHM13_13220 [Acidobacteria bacterium]|nr:MAG: hypothetical protein EHM13_13220 [Acidobacteriota bacterium]